MAEPMTLSRAGGRCGVCSLTMGGDAMECRVCGGLVEWRSVAFDETQCRRCGATDSQVEEEEQDGDGGPTGEERLENVIEEWFRESFRQSSKRMVFSSPEQLASFMTFAIQSKLPVGGGYVRSDELQPIIRRVAARLFPVVMNERHR